MTIIPKHLMTEEDIKLNYITPSLINSGWKDKITMETKVKFTDGKINIQGNITVREPAKKADYILYINANNPIAVVEAKDNKHTVSFGIQQAMEYAKMLQVPFAYSSNGDGFCEHDFLTGKERQLGLDEFPTYDELVARYKQEVNNGAGLTPKQEKIINQPYYSSATTFSPRYYQRIAINKTVEAIANGQNRLLLVMATGTGKTYTAFQICYRLLKSGLKKKILYLADRNILVDQSIQQDFAPLEKTIHKIDYSKEDPTKLSSYEVYFSLYQQLSDRKNDEEVEDEEVDVVSKLSALFKPDFFDLIIVDECHRGSAKKDSNWRKILEYFNTATQIGMTATPKETKYISNIDYFGEPIYTYSLRNGIDDGFLAPFKVINITTDIGDGWRPMKGQCDVYGNLIEDRIYNNKDYDYNIIIEDRIYQVANEITKYLKSTDRMQKTIVFCPTEEAADRMRNMLYSLNYDLAKDNPDYIVRITGSDDFGKSKLKHFISVTAEFPVIATTSKLLSTGVDCKMVKLIVLDQMISSMTDFKQIIGRGTRLREKEGKLSFTVMDFRGVTRLFADPDWDGPIEMNEGFDPDRTTSKPDNGWDCACGEKNIKTDICPVCGAPRPTISITPVETPYVNSDGCKVKVINRVVQVYDSNGVLLKTEGIIDYTKTNIVGEYASLDNFIFEWSNQKKKETIKKLLHDRGIDLDMLKADQNMQDVDDFDFICHVAFNAKPLTRKERANNVKKKDFFSKYSGTAKEVLEALLDKYMDNGIYDIESTDVLKLDPIKKYGNPSTIVKLFGGKEAYLNAVNELATQIYSAVA